MTNKNIQLYFFLILLLVVFVFNVAVFLPFLTLFAVVAIFAVVFYPLFKNIKKSIVKNGNVAALFTIIIVAIIVLIPLTFFTIQVFLEAKDIYTNIGSFHNTLSVMSSSINSKVGAIIPSVSIDLSSYLASIFNSLTSSIGSIFSSLFHFVTILFLGFVALFFFLRDGDKFIKKLSAVSPLDSAHDDKILDKLKRTINSIVKGSLVIAGIQGILTWIGFVIFGVPSPALWGALTVFASLIPGVGTAIVVAPAIIYLFYTGTLFNAIGLLIWGIVIVGLVDNVIRPFLVGKEVNIHPFMVLMSIFGGLLMFGAIGFLLGPLLLSFFSVLVELYPTITKGVLDNK
jgi:predicted PurR-regulated permease PerM